MSTSSASILFCGPQSIARLRALEACIRSHVALGDICYFADLEHPLGLPFFGISRLLRPLIESLHENQPDILVKYAPEVLAIWPELRSSKYFLDAPTIDFVALGGTKRRLHKDSEKIFRIIHALASLVFWATQNLLTDKHRSIVLACENLEGADRLTLCTLFHIVQRCNGRLPVVIAAAVDLELLTDAEPRDGPWLWGKMLEDRFCSVTKRAWAEHARLLKLLVDAPQFKRSLLPEGVHELYPLEEEILSLSTDVPMWAKIQAIGGAPIPYPADIHDPDAADRQLDICNRVLSRNGLSAIRRKIPLEEKRALHRQIASQLRVNHVQSEEILTQLVFHEIHGNELNQASVSVLPALDASLGFSFNFEVMLLCASEFLHAVKVQSKLDEIALGVKLYVALVECYLEDYSSSFARFSELLQESNSDVLRAQICFYMGLMEAKCKGNIEGAQSLLRSALVKVDGGRRRHWQAALEFGWLSNALAFTQWKSKKPLEARQLVDAALEGISPFENNNAQIINLKINLINNSSVLYESLGDIKNALSEWEKLEPLCEAIPGGRFTKSFLYRKGWLRLCEYELEDALRNYIASFKIAEKYNDRFHMDIISRACGYIAALSRRLPEAKYWYAKNRSLRYQLGDVVGLCDASISLAIIARMQNSEDEIREWLNDGCDLAGQAGLLELEKEIRLALDNHELLQMPGSGDNVGLAPGLSLEKPKMKLTTPFAIGHLVSNHAMHHHTHASMSPTRALNTN